MNCRNRRENPLADRRHSFFFSCKNLKGVKRQFSRIYGHATWDLNVKVIGYWFYPKCHRRAHLVDHQRYTMPTGAGPHDTGLLLFTDRNKQHVDTRDLDKVDDNFLSLCVVFHSVSWEYLRSERRSETQGQSVLAANGICHGLATSNIGVCQYDPHNTGHVEVLQHLFYSNVMSFCINRIFK